VTEWFQSQKQSLE